jgi:hypothetical protein
MTVPATIDVSCPARGGDQGVKSSESARAERFITLVDSRPESDDYADTVPVRLIDDLIFGFLLWESTGPNARQAFKQLKAQLIDANEIRVCLPDDFATIIGPKYPKAAMRSRRIRSVLTDLFHKQNEVTLDQLAPIPAKDAAKYLADLHGMHKFVLAHMSARLGMPVLPVDDLLIKALIRQKVLEPGIAKNRDRVAIVEQRLSDLIPDGNHRQIHLRLRDWLAEMEPKIRKKTAKSSGPSDSDSHKSKK